MQNDINNIISLLLLLFCGFAFLSLVFMRYFRPDHEGYQRNIIYGASLFACGLCSYLYTTGFTGLSTPLLKRFDHAAIFLLIAGTYTPFATRLILGPFRIRLLCWIWGIAIGGVLLRLLITTGYDKAFIALYLIAGWTFIIALPEVIRRVPRTSLIFLGSGAIVYSGGAVIFAIDPGEWTVSIWHTLVLIAAALHYVAVVTLNISQKQKIFSDKFRAKVMSSKSRRSA